MRTQRFASLHQVLILLEGGCQFRVEPEVNCRFLPAPGLIIVPAGNAHSLALYPQTRSYCVSVCDPLLRQLGARESAFREVFAGPHAVQLPELRPDGQALESCVSNLLE